MVSFEDHLSLFNLSLEELEQLQEGTTLKKFNADEAWKLGCLTRVLAIELFPKQSLVIDITLASGQVLFHTSSGSGTAVDNDEWVNRKKKVVLRIGKPSFMVGQKLRMKKMTMEESLGISSMEYASHGGSVPIKIDGFDNLIGALTVSGLPQGQDHLLATTALKKFRDLQ